MNDIKNFKTIHIFNFSQSLECQSRYQMTFNDLFNYCVRCVRNKNDNLYHASNIAKLIHEKRHWKTIIVEILFSIWKGILVNNSHKHVFYKS